MAPQTEEERKMEAKQGMRILLVVLLALAAWGGSIVIWGVPGLYIPAVIMVPVLMGMLIWISRG